MVYPLTFTQSISTHAPRTGSDFDDPFDPVERIEFQPTLPARGATVPSLISPP